MEDKLNKELLLAEDSDEKRENKEPRRNSKDELITRIIQIAEVNEIPILHSDTKLRRMTKPQLSQLLADLVEKSIRNEMAKQVGAKPGATDSIIALGALRMMHDICAKGTEKAINIFLPTYGYEIEGFADSLKDPSVREATDACLVEIAQDSEILQYVQSPWARLAIAWSGALVTSIQQKKVRYRNQYYAPRMEPRQHFAPNPRREHRPSRREEDGKIDSDGGSTVEAIKEV
jgi:hypothetical protein